MRAQLAVLAACSVAFTACGDDDKKDRTPLDTSSYADAVQMTPTDGQVSGKYRDNLANHRGCVPRASYDGNSEPLVKSNTATVTPGTPANIPGYSCAAIEWTQNNEDTSKPIVILVHGNSSGVPSWEEYFSATTSGATLTSSANGSPITGDTAPRQMLASKLIAAGFRVYGFDARTDLIFTASDPENSQNTADNMDHGWSVPMLQSMIKAVIKANPGRKISLVGHSLGVSEIRDALRRLFVEYAATADGAVNPFASVKDLVYLSGANHGVVGGGVGCNLSYSGPKSMTNWVNCELGDREAYQVTYFYAPLNGDNDAFAAPCSDGSTAFGQTGVCSGNTVSYTTVVMQDKVGGGFQDEFVTEASAHLGGGNVDNHLISLSDFDTSGYFFDGLPGVFANHFGSARSNVGMEYVVNKLND